MFTLNAWLMQWASTLFSLCFHQDWTIFIFSRIVVDGHHPSIYIEYNVHTGGTPLLQNKYHELGAKLDFKKLIEQTAFYLFCMSTILNDHYFDTNEASNDYPNKKLSLIYAWFLKWTW